MYNELLLRRKSLLLIHSLVSIVSATLALGYQTSILKLARGHVILRIRGGRLCKQTLLSDHELSSSINHAMLRSIAKSRLRCNSQVTSSYGRCSLWTSSTALGHDNLKSAFDATFTKSTHAKHRSRPRLGVLCVSRTFPDLQELRRYLADNVPSLDNTIGVLTAPVEGQNALSILLASDQDAETRTFFSTTRGRNDKSVGRWQSPEDRLVEKEEAKEQQDTGWEAFIGASKSAVVNARDITTGLEDIDPEALFMLTDHQPQHILQSLDGTFPNATKFGILGSHTPFVTGRPTTLFYNDKILSHGAVGLAFTRPIQRAALVYPPTEAISDILTVTSANGNMVHSLNDHAAASVLLQSVREKSKDVLYYLGVVDANGDHSRLHQVTAGDPARGIIGLEQSSSGVNKGDRVQILKIIHSSNASSNPDFDTISLHCNSDIETTTNTVSSPSVRQTFIAASENGVIVSRDDAWVSSVPNSYTSFSL